MSRATRPPSLAIPVALATGLEAAAAALVLGLNRLGPLALALLLHVLASSLAVVAARRRRAATTVVERDLVWTTAFCVPIFGPPMAWALMRPAESEEAENAHAVFDRYADHVKPAVADYERTLFTGDYDRDLARELDAESYHEVLRHGTTGQKRNALHRLADLGEPKHLALVRQCLLDPEHEVRLYAYAEIERASRGFEEEIAKRSRQLEEREGAPEALLALAKVHLDYASSGVHDEEMATFYYRTAARFAAQVRAAPEPPPEATWVEASALARVGEHDDALAKIAALPPDAQAHPRSCLARAEVAFRRRDFAGARAEAERMRAAGEAPPAWLEALGRDA